MARNTVRVSRDHGGPGWRWVCIDYNACPWGVPTDGGYAEHLPTVTDAIDAACEHIRTHHTTTEETQP